MRRITALLQTRNDGLRLGRCLETLYPCDDILVIDHGSEDDTVRVARDYGARVVVAKPDGKSPPYGLVAGLQSDAWILCLDPCESLSEGLAASLFEWKSANRKSHEEPPGAVVVREETAQGWAATGTAQTRLVPALWDRWQKHFPQHDPRAAALEGDLLRFVFP